MPEAGAARGVEAVAGRVGLEVFVVQVFFCTAAEQVAGFQVAVDAGTALTIAAAGQFPGLVVVIPALQVTAGIVEQVAYSSGFCLIISFMSDMVMLVSRGG
ncbi:hypothetical protein AP060_00130 [Pseudomonas sp. TAD18]|nr:hypothetical protein AP060_00130 [Pseudomonas sp. TAD18]KVV12142.1 hypothetical protein AP059_00107 [Pseudomonas sp. TAA207]